MPVGSAKHDHPLAAQLGANIRAIRGAADLSIDDVATAAGVSGITLRKVESAHRWPGPDVLARIATALGVSPADLLSESRKTAKTA